MSQGQLYFNVWQKQNIPVGQEPLPIMISNMNDIKAG